MSDLTVAVDAVADPLQTVEQLVAHLRRHLDNITAAEGDGVRWVSKDNAAWAREAGDRLLEAAARVYVAAESLESLGMKRAVAGGER